MHKRLLRRWLQRSFVSCIRVQFAELSIFVRYVDSDTHKISEEFLGMVEVIGSKGAEALFNLICKVLEEKGNDINRMLFNGMDGTSTMSGERSGHLEGQ